MLPLLLLLLILLELVLLLHNLLLLLLMMAVLLLLMRGAGTTEALVRVEVCKLVQAAMEVVIAHITRHIMSVIIALKMWYLFDALRTHAT